MLLKTVLSTGRVDQVVAFAIFGFSLIALYSASALYHLLPLSALGVARLRQLDHMMIFVLIAGTYTPLCLLGLEGAWRWGLLCVMWGLALGGIVFKVLWMDAPCWLSVMIYLGMGWLVVIAVPALSRTIGPEGIERLGAGGVIYSVGALIYALERPNQMPGLLGAHELWHLFVIAGSACHFWVAVRDNAPLM